MHHHLNETPPRPSTQVAEIPKALDELIVNFMAKAPNDRPWDAAAVGVVLTELRDKAERGATIAMVWPNSKPASRKSPASGDVLAPVLLRLQIAQGTLDRGAGSVCDLRRRAVPARAPRATTATRPPSRPPIRGRDRPARLGPAVDWRVDRLLGLSSSRHAPIPSGRAADGLQSQHDWLTARDDFLSTLLDSVFRITHIGTNWKITAR